MTITEYNTIHQWNLRHWSKTGRCRYCKLEKPTQWSNKSGLYIKGDKKDWQELCVSCHKKYDYKTFGVPTGLGKRGKDKTKRKTRVFKGTRRGPYKKKIAESS